ncbi:PIN domain-containing protein [Jiangella anatolica]|uniref:HTH OST-type domain-containing protein n=1 Tax=Jiangella anatolica TaxID=2670374 RepID=A0A2W2CVL8_9ACTN|nr:PIN domain-containing protein [Jiangella anatolica]PZF84273.1 hypothetical protein C1I92_09515 [Jiangella anatolica]
MDDEDRIALFLDYENLAIGARQDLRLAFDVRPIADALAERGRVVVRRAYADWSYFDEDRRMLTRSHVELIEMPQRMGTSRKNAADIKLAVDAVELAFVRDYVSTFVVCTGDSDFTPLVYKLRELNKSVIGVGIRASTSALLPPACDEFLYYDDLEGIEPPPVAEPAPAGDRTDRPDRDLDDLAGVVAQSVAGLQRTGGPVTASTLKRTLLRKDPTFNEADHGFRAFGELLRHLADRHVIELADGSAKGDPEVLLASLDGQQEAFELLRSVVEELTAKQGPVALSGLKDQLRRVRPDFGEQALGFRSFLQFARAAATTGAIELRWDDAAGDYLLTVT